MRLVACDMHISNKSSNRQAQHSYLDLVEREHPDEILFVGDTEDRSEGEETTLRDELTLRLRDIAKRIPTTLIAGNFPHDDYGWLISIANRLSPCRVCNEVWEPDFRHLFTHGAQWDPVIGFWNHFRCVERVLPALIRTFLVQTPSTLAYKGDYDSLVKLTGPMHQRAQKFAIDEKVTVFMGHTHLRQSLNADPVHPDWVEVLGSIGSGPYVYMVWEEGKYEIRKLFPEGC